MNIDRKALQAELEQHYRWFHRHPELALNECKTTARIKEILSALPGVELMELGLPTGALARIRGAKPGPTVALRADVDALPIEENTGLAYASEHPGCMHACGHDFHTTALLGAARLLSGMRDVLRGTVILLFQPAEEAEHGAQRVVETGLFQREGIEKIFGIHVAPELPVGTVALRPGPDHASVDRFLYHIEGKGCHGASPHLGLDPIPAAARLVGAIQEIVSRGIDPIQSAVVSVTRLQSGSSWNIVPDFAELEGTIRSFDADVRTYIVERMRSLGRGLEAEGFRVSYDCIYGCPATNNDPLLTALAERVASGLGLRVTEAPLSMGGEDFSCYQQLVPGAFIHVGVSGTAPLHNAGSILDVAPLSDAAILEASLVLEAVQ